VAVYLSGISRLPVVAEVTSVTLATRSSSAPALILDTQVNGMVEHLFCIARGQHKGHHERYSHSPDSDDTVTSS
jgi:hypothetical protein